MVQVVNHGGRDAWILSSHPSDNHGGSPYLRMAGADHYALLRLQYTIPKGATVTSATLELHARGAFAAQTVTATRASDSWGDENVNWNTQPGVTGTGASATVAALADGDLISLDVTSHVQKVASGAKNYGWRLSVSGTAVVKVYGLDAGSNQPRLVINYADKPGVPTDLRPSDGSVVSDPRPTVTFSYTDVTGEGMGALRVQCDPAGNETSPAFDSGWRSDVEGPELDLSTTTFAALAAGGSTMWRVQARGSDGGESAWSDWAQFTYQPQIVVTPSSPSSGTPFVYEPTPPITFTTDKTMSVAQVRITKQGDHTHELWDSGWFKVSGTTGSITVPKKWRGNRVLRDDIPYALNIRAKDTETAREATPGHPTFGYTWLDFTADTDAAIGPVDTLTAAQDGITPWVLLTWTRSTAPDSFVVRMDGHVVESNIDPADVLVSGTQYQWRYQGAAPLVSHAFHVRAVVNDHQSTNGPDATVTTKPQGVWLIDFGRNLSFVLGGRTADDWAMTDQVAVYTRLDGSQMQIHTGMSGLGDHFEGTIGYSQGDGRTVAQLEADLWSIKEHPDATLQLVAGDQSIPVKVRNLSDSVASNSMPDSPRRRVSFNFFQDGDLPFDVRL